jgi:hypothetical protein
VAQLCRELRRIAYSRKEPVPFDDARAVLRALQQVRWFDLEESVAEVLVQTGQDHPEIRRRLVQALIDQGKLTSAQAHLQRLIPETAEHPDEHAEARGLLGRALKQRYIDAAAPGVARNAWALQRAITTYAAAYHETVSDPLWHGINLVACLARARRDGVKVPAGVPDERALAARLLALAGETYEEQPWNVWAAATALEACVALDDEAGALRWVETYVTHKRVTQERDAAFELGSTLRQLTEVWQLDASRGGVAAKVLAALRSAALGNVRGSVELSGAEVRADLRETPTLEKVFGLDSVVSFPWYAKGLERARGVARITDAFDKPEGTGFLVRGGDLFPGSGDAWLLLTNDHVVNDQGRRGLRPGEARVSFQALAPDGGAERHEVDRVLWCSPPHELDAAVLRLKTVPRGVETLEPFPLSGELPAVRKPPEAPARIYVIGHALGGGLSFSIHDNLLLGCRVPLVHYRTPTQPGSSGSPVFNDRWELVAIHHGGDERVRRLDGEPGRYAANEGISIRSIREAVQGAGA